MLLAGFLLMFYFGLAPLVEKVTKKTTEIFLPIFLRKRMEDEMEEAVPALSEAEKQMRRQVLSVVLEEALSGRAKTDPDASMAILEGRIEGHRWVQRHVDDLNYHLQRPQRHLKDLLQSREAN